MSYFARILSTSLVMIILLGRLSGVGGVWAAGEETIIQNTLKIKTYEARDNGSYVYSSYGSAVVLSKSQILTNAHVILGSDGEPTGLYEVCYSQSYERIPSCRHTARLVAYDAVADLALLEIPYTDALVPQQFSTGSVAIGSSVSMYGYPRIGGETITRTEGRIAGYEQGMYKVDGTIDHGNSGGGAFDSLGRLIGIPTAISSENGVIGYMIPVKRIQSFLTRSTSNYQTFTDRVDSSFANFIKKNQYYASDLRTYRWGPVLLKNPRNYNFHMTKSMVSVDRRMILWSFSDEYDRVRLNFSCTDDAGEELGWQVRKNGLDTERAAYPSWSIIDDESDRFFTLSESARGYISTITIYYKQYDSCFAEIQYLDEKKDALSIENAKRIAKNLVSFTKPYFLANTATYTPLKVTHMPSNLRFIRSIDPSGEESITMGVGLDQTNWIHGSVVSDTVDSLSALSQVTQLSLQRSPSGNIEITALSQSKDTPQISPIVFVDGKKGILTTTYDTDKKQYRVMLVFFSKKGDGYSYTMWKGLLPSGQSPVVDILRRTFENIRFSGTSLL